MPRYHRLVMNRLAFASAALLAMVSSSAMPADFRAGWSADNIEDPLGQKESVIRSSIEVGHWRFSFMCASNSAGGKRVFAALKSLPPLMASDAAFETLYMKGSWKLVLRVDSFPAVEVLAVPRMMPAAGVVSFAGTGSFHDTPHIVSFADDKIVDLVKQVVASNNRIVVATRYTPLNGNETQDDALVFPVINAKEALARVMSDCNIK